MQVTGRVAGGGAAMWAGRDIRRRWLSLTMLGVLAGLSAALAMASMAGARRADTAFDRLSVDTRAADVVVFPSQSGAGIYDWSGFEALPYVEEVAPWNLVWGSLDAGEGTEAALLFMPTDRRWFGTVDRPVVREGRLWDPSVPGEVMLDETAAAEFDVEVGQRFTFQPYTQDRIFQGEPDGPVVRAQVVGIIRRTTQFLFTGMIALSPGTFERYGDQIGRVENAHVRLNDPTRDVAALRRDVHKVLPEGTPVLDLHSVEGRVGTAISVERLAQLLLGIAVAIAGLVFVGQALTRSVAQVDRDALALRAIGFTRRDRAWAATAPHLLSAAVAVPVALGGAWAMSARFPIGYGRSVDPDVGFHVDWLVVGPGLALAALLLVGGAYAMAWVRGGRLGTSGQPRRSRVIASLRRGVPLPIGLGATMAVDSGRGRRSIPVGPALFGAVVGVLGIVGTLTIDHGLRDAVSNPERAGVTWDAQVVAGSDDYSPEPDTLDEDFTRDIRSRSGLAAAATFGRIVLEVDDVGVPTFDVKPVRGDLSLVTTTGQAPGASDEIALGPETARQLDVGVGDLVTVTPDPRVADARAVRMRVVGLALFPHEVHSGFTEGAWITPSAMAGLAPGTDPAEGTGVEQAAYMRWRDGVDAERSVAAMQKDFGSTDREASSAELPPELANLEGVLTVPKVLVGFLVVLAIAALAHALVTTIRQRRVDFAVLRAIGFTKPMTATVVGSHSTTVGLIGLVVGIPIGLVLGRLGWTWIANRVPLVYESPLALAAVIGTILAALVIANVVAVLPGQRAARLGPAEVLRSE